MYKYTTLRTTADYVIEDNIIRENRIQRRKEEVEKLKKSPEYIQRNINHFTRQKEILEKNLQMQLLSKQNIV